MNVAVFLERDGILNRRRTEQGHQVSPRSLDEFRIRKETAPHIRALKEAGYLIIATTNQPGISRGYLSRRELDLMHTFLRRALPLDDILVCPHDEMDRCHCRKPKPGLIQEAAFKWRLELGLSFVISDKWQDAEAARLVGSTSLLIDSPWIGSGHHDYVLPNLEAAVQKILQLRPGPGHVTYQNL